MRWLAAVGRDVPTLGVPPGPTHLGAPFLADGHHIDDPYPSGHCAVVVNLGPGAPEPSGRAGRRCES